MGDEQERLKAVEIEVGFLKSSFSKVENALTQLAEDMHKLALADAERAEDRRTIERMFREFEGIEDQFTRIWERTDKIIEDNAKAEQRRLEDELKARNRWLGELGKMALAVVGAMVLYHFGVKPL